MATGIGTISGWEVHAACASAKMAPLCGCVSQDGCLYTCMSSLRRGQAVGVNRAAYLPVESARGR
eukprot:scaffold4768_cov412-Prasinococcus_capsulatus_cf.AAC.1